MRSRIVIAALALGAFAGYGCSPSNTEPPAGSASTGTSPAPANPSVVKPVGGTLTVVGSDTLLQLAEAWAEAFHKVHPEIPVEVRGGGSGVGLTALVNGQTEIADASRPIEKKEIDEAKSKGINPVEHTIARDALTIIVSPSNPINELTMDQLAGIYLGTTTNWKQLGGTDSPITAAARDTSSGTYAYFKEHVLKKKEYGAKTLHLPSNSAIAGQVATDAGTIGYVGMGYVNSKVKSVKIKKDTSSPGIEPTVANVLNNSYPLSRPLFEYTNGTPTGNVKTWIDFITGSDGQAIVKQKEFIPVTK